MKWMKISSQKGKQTNKQTPKLRKRTTKSSMLGFGFGLGCLCSELNASRSHLSFKNYSFSICFPSICDSKAWLMENNLLQRLSSPDACNLIINLEYTSGGSQDCWERTLGREEGRRCSVCFLSNYAIKNSFLFTFISLASESLYIKGKFSPS